jgi:hypothetical protein
MLVQGTEFSALTIAGGTATFEGSGTCDGAPCRFAVTVSDSGEQGEGDTFAISVGDELAEGGSVHEGNVEIR